MTARRGILKTSRNNDFPKKVLFRVEKDNLTKLRPKKHDSYYNISQEIYKIEHYLK